MTRGIEQIIEAHRFVDSIIDTERHIKDLEAGRQ